MTSDIVERITEYLSAGGLFNPELMEHDKVRDMVIQCRDEIESLRSRLAEAEYQWKYWMGVADDNGIKSIKARLAEAEALLYSTRLTLIEVAEHSDFEEGAEFGVRLCCYVRDYRPHADSCAVMRSISGIDAYLGREP